MNFKSARDLPEINKLPELLADKDGREIKNPGEWLGHRDYLKSLLKRYMYGEIPEGDFDVTGEIIFSEEVFNRQAVHEFVRVRFGGGLSFVAEITRPNKSGKCRVITYIAFPNARNYDVEAEAVLKRGYALALFNYEQVVPDRPDINISELPIAGLLGAGLDLKAVGMWAFCNMRLIDYMDTAGYALENEYITAGHSRNGKAALCAGIFDERVRITVPNNSGCGGCGCFRFLGGRGLTQDARRTESLQVITQAFPHWFSANLNEFYDEPGKIYSEAVGLNNRLPFDLHANKALIAPRVLLSLEAYGDEWANPYGSGLTHGAARQVYDLLGVPDNIAIRYREGEHEFNTQDWLALLDFCDKF